MKGRMVLCKCQQQHLHQRKSAQDPRPQNTDAPEKEQENHQHRHHKFQRVFPQKRTHQQQQGRKTNGIGTHHGQAESLFTQCLPVFEEQRYQIFQNKTGKQERKGNDR